MPRNASPQTSSFKIALVCKIGPCCPCKHAFTVPICFLIIDRLIERPNVHSCLLKLNHQTSGLSYKHIKILQL